MREATIERVLRHFPDARKTSDDPPRWAARCPAHPDNNPSLQITAGRVRLMLKCWSQDCPEDQILRAIGLRLADLYYDQNAGLTLRQYAEQKKLPIDFLIGLGVTEGAYAGRPHVKFRYRNQAGEVVGIKRRRKMHGRERFRWRTGDKPTLYGLWRSFEQWVLLVEGESNAQTCWLHEIPAIGIPGTGAWRSEWVDHLTDLDVWLWEEPDKAGRGLTVCVARDLPDALVIPSPEGVTDISDMHLAGQDVVQVLEELKAEARPASEVGVDNWLEEELGIRVLGLTMLRSDPPRLTMETDRGEVNLGDAQGLDSMTKFCRHVLEDTYPHFAPTPSRGAWPAIRQALADKIIDEAAPDATDVGVMRSLVREYLEGRPWWTIEQVAEEERGNFERFGAGHPFDLSGRLVVKEGRPYIHLPTFIKWVQKREHMDRKKIAVDLHAIEAERTEMWGWKRKYRLWWLPDDVIEAFDPEEGKVHRREGTIKMSLTPDLPLNLSEQAAQEAWDKGEGRIEWGDHPASQQPE